MGPNVSLRDSGQSSSCYGKVRPRYLAAADFNAGQPLLCTTDTLDIGLTWQRTILRP